MNESMNQVGRYRAARAANKKLVPFLLFFAEKGGGGLGRVKKILIRKTEMVKKKGGGSVF